MRLPVAHQYQHYILFLFSFLWITSTHAQGEVFEGVLTYRVKVECNEGYVHCEYMKKKYGNVMYMYISKNGDYMEEYDNSGSKGLDFFLYKQQTAKYYAAWRNLDSLYVYDATQPASQLDTILKGPNDTIIGRPCKSIIVKSFVPAQEVQLEYTYYYDKTLKADPSVYRSHKDGFMDMVMSLSQSWFMKIVGDLGNFVVTKTLIDVRAMSLEKELFEIPDGYPQAIR